MPMTGTVDAANARVDLFVDFSTEPGVHSFATVFRRIGHVNADSEYVRGLFGSTLLGEQAYVSDHEAPLDAQIWYVAVSDAGTVLAAGPFTIPSQGYVWLKDPGRPWADLKLDLCENPSRGEAVCADELVIVSDTFTRTSVASWGAADTGQSWTNTGGAGADYAVTGGTGRHTHTAVSVSHYSAVPVTDADTSITVDWSMPTVPASDGNYVSVISRFTDTSHFYSARVQINTAGNLILSLRKANGADSQLGSGQVLNIPFVAGAWFRTRFETEGTQLRARVWPADQAEGTRWDLTATDADLAGPGSIGTRSLIGSGSTLTLPYTFQFDNLSVSRFAPLSVDIAWVGFRDKVRAVDAGLFPVLDAERPADVFARRKDITTGIMFLSRSIAAVRGIYELFTSGGPILVQVPEAYGMNAPYGQRDRYYQPDDLTESYLSQDQRKVYRLWSAGATAVEAPIGEPQGTDTANWCALEETYPTMGDYADSGFTWGQAATGLASTGLDDSMYGGGLYGDGPYGDGG